jgi:hypothetical protein
VVLPVPLQLLALVYPTASPTNTPTAAVLSPVLVAIPSAAPTLLTTATATPSLSNCHGSTAEKRIERLLQILDAATDSTNLSDDVTARSQATKWLWNEYQVYPDDEKLIQRWALAVVYFATGGNEWFQCRRASADPTSLQIYRYALVIIRLWARNYFYRPHKNVNGSKSFVWTVV